MVLARYPVSSCQSASEMASEMGLKVGHLAQPKKAQTSMCPADSKVVFCQFQKQNKHKSTLVVHLLHRRALGHLFMLLLDLTEMPVVANLSLSPAKTYIESLSLSQRVVSCY